MTRENLINRYDVAASNWTVLVAKHGYPAAYRDFIDWALPVPAARREVCDIGTGSGAFAEQYLNSQGAPQTLWLLDASRAMLKVAESAIRHKARKVVCVRQNFEEFESDQRFDIVLASHVIEHCDDPAVALGKLWKTVTPGGSLLMVVSRPHWCQWLIWLRWRHRWFSPAAMLQMSKSNEMPIPALFRFSANPPSRTSFGYLFHKPQTQKVSPC